jgi:phage-related protein
MRRKLAPGEKPLFLVGSSKRDLLAMPDPVVRQMGAALSVAQYGGKHPDAKPWKGLGPGVFEVVSAYKTDTFRAGYVVRFEHALLRPALFSEEIAKWDAHGEYGC